MPAGRSGYSCGMTTTPQEPDANPEVVPSGDPSVGPNPIPTDDPPLPEPSGV